MDTAFERAEAHRLRAHFDGALAVLAARDTGRLPRGPRARRARLVDDLRAYQARGRFPRNDRFPSRVPFFVDSAGTRCAMAHLIETSGHARLVERVAGLRNNALVRELGGDDDLLDWLSGHGMTVAEAARIQPGYGPDWGPMEFCEGAPYKSLVRATVIDSPRARITAVYASQIKVRVGEEVTLLLPPPDLHPGQDVFLTTIPFRDSKNEGIGWRATYHRISGDRATMHSSQGGTTTVPLADAPRLLRAATCTKEVLALQPTWPGEPTQPTGEPPRPVVEPPRPAGEPAQPAGDPARPAGQGEAEPATSSCARCASAPSSGGAAEAAGMAAALVLCGWVRRIRR